MMLCSAKPQTPLYAREAICAQPGASVGYRPPSLWSAVEVLARLPHSMRRDVRIHGLASNTRLGLRPTSCPACEQVVVAAIQHFNGTGAFDWIEAVQRLGCECRERWRARCEERPQGSLRARMGEFVDALEQQLDTGEESS